MEKIALKWEFLGFLVSFGIGSMLHFVYEWSGNWLPVAIFGAVNESTWEHLKMAFWPMVLWLLIEAALIKKKHVDVRNFMIAKALGIYITPVTTSLLFYTYIALGQSMNLASGIGLFAMGLLAGFMASAAIMSAPRWSKPANIIGVVLLGVATCCFSTMTYFPPQFFLFQDPLSGLYGILP